MGTKILHQIKKWSLLVPLTTLFMLLSVMSYAQETQTVYNPVVTTDKLDYAPGEIAFISGSGWEANGTVEITIFCTVINPDYYEFSTTTDANGDFSGVQFFIEDYHFGEEFHLVAEDGSGNKAETYFTDGGVEFTTTGLPTGEGVLVEYDYYPTGQGQPTLTAGSQTTTFILSSRNNQTVRFSYESSVTISDVLYNLEEVTISGGEIMDDGTGGYDYEFSSPNATQTITGIYVACEKPIIAAIPISASNQTGTCKANVAFGEGINITITDINTYTNVV